MCREELFYQLALRQFGRFSRINLKPAPSLRKILRLAVERAKGREEGTTRSVDEIIEVRLLICTTLVFRGAHLALLAADRLHEHLRRPRNA